MLINYFPQGGGSNVEFVPQFTGRAKLVLLDGGKAGYMEFYTSGTLTWLDGKIPETVDLFCVGGGGSGYDRYNDGSYQPGAGGGSGYTTTVLGATLPTSISITVGAGSGTGGAAGTTSIGTLCIAAGGNSAVTKKGGNGGCGGGARGSAGGSNGSNGGGVYGGIGQGTPTTDLLGRKHAGGGSGGRTEDWTGYPSSASAGASDFTEGRGGNAHSIANIYTDATGNGRGLGGGGFGGGGGGGNWISSSYYGGVGGQGFAMIAWGDYSSAIVS